jgi:hypothetical protein
MWNDELIRQNTEKRVYSVGASLQDTHQGQCCSKPRNVRGAIKRPLLLFNHTYRSNSFKNVQTNLSERLIQYKTRYKYDSVTLGLKFNICIIISFPFCRSISSILFIPNLLIFQLDSGTKILVWRQNSCSCLMFSCSS